MFVSSRSSASESTVAESENYSRHVSFNTNKTRSNHLELSNMTTRKMRGSTVFREFVSGRVYVSRQSVEPTVGHLRVNGFQTSIFFDIRSPPA